MIEFEYRLPRFYVKGARVGQYNNPEMVLPCALTTTDCRLGSFLHLLHNAVADERRLVFIDGRVLSCAPNWIRDHVHMMKAFRHWEYDLRSFLEYIIDTQTEEGFYFELIKQLDDRHWSYVNEDCRRLFPEDHLSLVRLELEADVEYLVVEGVWQYYRATGDLAWVGSVLPSLERAINYMTSSPKRWNKDYGLVMRPFTIDTWDFTSEKGTSTDRRIHEDEPMSIMHGDNSGVYAAMRILSFFHRKLGKEERAAAWERRAEELRENMLLHLWNGKFFMHQLHIGHGGKDDRERERLSLSNGYDINRGVTDLVQSRAIIEEYLARRETTKAFAEWFSIDPPYPEFNGYRPGEYVNGAISPFTAAELSLASFRNGYEEYGWDILSRMMTITEREGRVNFLYAPYDKEGQNATGPSGWGAAGLLHAVDEGLAGVVDADCLYRVIDFSPRFTVTEYRELRYITGYEVSGVFVDVRFILTEEGMRYDLYSGAERVNAHILLPKGRTCKRLLLNGKDTEFSLSRVGDSLYADAAVAGERCLSFEILF